MSEPLEIAEPFTRKDLKLTPEQKRELAQLYAWEKASKHQPPKKAKQ